MERVSMAWLAALIAWAARAGANRKRLLDAADLTEAELEEPHVAPLVAQEFALWDAIQSALRDPAAGLKFGASLHGARAFGIVGYWAAPRATGKSRWKTSCATTR